MMAEKMPMTVAMIFSEGMVCCRKVARLCCCCRFCFFGCGGGGMLCVCIVRWYLLVGEKGPTIHLHVPFDDPPTIERYIYCAAPTTHPMHVLHPIFHARDLGRLKNHAPGGRPPSRLVTYL